MRREAINRQPGPLTNICASVKLTGSQFGQRRAPSAHLLCSASAAHSDQACPHLRTRCCAHQRRWSAPAARRPSRRITGMRGPARGRRDLRESPGMIPPAGCPIPGTKRTYGSNPGSSHFDPKRTLASTAVQCSGADFLPWRETVDHRVRRCRENPYRCLRKTDKMQPRQRVGTVTALVNSAPRALTVH